MTIDNLTTKTLWNFKSFKSYLMTPHPPLMKKKLPTGYTTITSGIARGQLRGGNLNVFANLLASREMPIEALDGAILFLEETGDPRPTLDRNLLALKLAGVFRRVSAIVFGRCDNCCMNPSPNENSRNCVGIDKKESAKRNPDNWTWSDLAYNYAKEAGVPAFTGMLFGHHMRGGQLVLPLGAYAEVDAGAGTVTFLHDVVTASAKAKLVDGPGVRVWMRGVYPRSPLDDGIHSR
jgi:muramoyltetrapeptide carboxypeptidase